MKLNNLEERWLICGGRPVHVWQSKSDSASHATTLVHLHGFGISGRYLLPTADLLASEYRTFVPNLPGYGRSVHPEHVLSIPELADALVDLLDVVGVERATLVGNSMGCIIAIETARKIPERIDRVVLVSPAGGQFNRPVFKGVAQLALDALREPPRMYTIAIPDYLSFGLLNTGKLFWQMIHYPAVDRFKETDVASLMVLGARDPLVNEDRLASGLSANPNIEIVRIEGAAHAVNYSHPAKLSSLIQQFVLNQPLVDDGNSPGTAIVLRQRNLEGAKGQVTPEEPVGTLMDS